MSRFLRLTVAEARAQGLLAPAAQKTRPKRATAPVLPPLPGSTHTHTWERSGKGAQCTTCLFFTSLRVLHLLGYTFEVRPTNLAECKESNDDGRS